MGAPVLAEIATTEGLIRQGNDGHPSPRLAERWSVSADALTWRFTLRPNTVFTDGTKLDSAAVKASIEQTLSRESERRLRPGLADLTGIEAPDPYTLVLRLRAPSAFLPEDMEINVTRVGPSGETVGAGPFRIVRRTPQEIELQANEGYYLGKPAVDRVVIRSFPTLRTAWASLLRREVDAISYVAQNALEFVGHDEINTYPFLRSYQYAIAFNSARPPFSNAMVRRAMNAAIERTKIISDVLSGAGEPSSGPLWPRHWAYDRSIPGYTFDPSMAAAILEASSLSIRRSPSGLLPSRFRFTCLIPAGYEVHERLALTIQKQLYDVGIDMQMEVVAPAQFDQRLRASDFDAALMDMISGPSFTRPYFFWRSSDGFKGLNLFSYRNPDADRWFDALRHAPDDAAFRAAASQLQRTLLQDPPALFVAWTQRTRAVSRRFDVPVAHGLDVLPELRLWRLNPGYTARKP